MTVGELENQLRSLREEFEDFAGKFKDNAETNAEVVQALASSQKLSSRIGSLETRMHDVDGKVAS